MPFHAGMYYQVHDDQPGADLPPVIFIHGAGGSHMHWPINLRRLFGWRVYAIDLPGHGKSEAGGLGSIAEYASCVHAWQASLRIQNAYLVGHSMGSAIALWLGLEHPGNTSGLALLGAAASLKVNPDLLALVSQPEGFLQAVKLIMRWSYAPQASPQLVDLATRRLAEVQPSQLYADFLACSAFDISGRLAEIDCPALVLSGELDKMTPVSGGQSLAGHIPGAQIRVIPAAGHMLMLEQPLAVQAALLEFLAASR